MYVFIAAAPKKKSENGDKPAKKPAPKKKAARKFSDSDSEDMFSAKSSPVSVLFS